MYKSKQETKKPNIYIASNYSNGVRESSLEIAEAVDQSPFVDNIFIAEGVYSVERLVELPDNLKATISDHVKNELALTDIMIVDRTYGDPIEWGYAIAKGIPYIEYNPTHRDHNPVSSGGSILETGLLEMISDFNYIKEIL